MKWITIIIAGLLAVMASPALCVAATYYVCAATGSPCNASDSNAGTSKTSTWLHAPGMPNFTGTYTAAAGDQIIFRGGDTWHFGNSGATPYSGGRMAFSHAGSAGNLIYIGADKTWYSGGSWTRPIFTGDNPVFNGTSFPASCSFPFGQSTALVSLSSYNQFDNIEFTGVCWTFAVGASPSIGMVSPGANDIISNDYCHGFTMTSTASDGMSCYDVAASNVTLNGDIFDGSDAPHWAAGNANCSANAAPCGTGIGIYDHAFVVENCVFDHMRVAGVLSDGQYQHDNLFQNMATAPPGNFESNQHDDAIMYYHGGTSASGVTEYFYNNTFIHNWIQEAFYMPVSGGSTAYIFGNIFFDSHYTTPGNGFNINAQSSGTQTLYVYNNTFDNDTDVPNSSGTFVNGFSISLYGNTNSCGNSIGIGWSGPIYAANNNLIGYSSLASLFTSRCGTTSFTVNDNGGNVILPTATARSDNYVQTTALPGDAPTSGSSPTVSTGTNQSSQCSTFSSDDELCTQSSGGPSYVSGSGVATFPALAANARGSTWDSGAYQFSAGSPAAATPTFSPVAGTYSGPQVVAISTTSGSVICYTTDGTTPATNGGAGCNAGNLYISAIGVSASETVEAIAGGTGFSDSTVASAAYVINGVTPRLTGRLLAKY